MLAVNVGMQGLGALLRFDFAVAEGMVGCEGRFERRFVDGKPDEQYGRGGTSQMILLLSGDRSPTYLKKGWTF